jgi:flavin reductase (DIM6/NTAB) family NADH-FMN oxidoreductase RutF
MRRWLQMVKEVDRIDLDVFDAIAHLPPAPVFLVASGAEEKDWNITTVGMFNVFSMFPVTVGIGVKTSRNLYKLLQDTPDFSLNLPSVDMVDTVKFCGEKPGKGVNKIKETGLTVVKGKRIKSPIIRESLLYIECKKLKNKEFEVGDHTWFLAEPAHTEVNVDYDKSKALLYWDGEYRAATTIVRPKEG